MFFQNRVLQQIVVETYLNQIVETQGLEIKKAKFVSITDQIHETFSRQ